METSKPTLVQVPSLWSLCWKGCLALAGFWAALVLAAAFGTQSPPEFLSSLDSWMLSDSEWTAISLGVLMLAGAGGLVLGLSRVRAAAKKQEELLAQRLLELQRSGELAEIRVTSAEQLPLEKAFRHLADRIQAEKKQLVEAQVRQSLVKMAQGLHADLASPLASLRAFARSWTSGNPTPPTLLEESLLKLESLSRELGPSSAPVAPQTVTGEAIVVPAAPAEETRAAPLASLVQLAADRLLERASPAAVEIRYAEGSDLAHRAVEVAPQTWLLTLLESLPGMPEGLTIRLQVEPTGAEQAQVRLLAMPEGTRLGESAPIALLSGVPAPWSLELPYPQRGELVVLDPTGTAGETLKRRCEEGALPEVTSLFAVQTPKELQRLLQEQPSLFEKAVFLIEGALPQEKRSGLEWAESLGLLRNTALLARRPLEGTTAERALSKRTRVIPIEWLDSAVVQKAQPLGLSRDVATPGRAAPAPTSQATGHSTHS